MARGVYGVWQRHTLLMGVWGLSRGKEEDEEDEEAEKKNKKKPERHTTSDACGWRSTCSQVLLLGGEVWFSWRAFRGPVLFDAFTAASDLLRRKIWSVSQSLSVSTVEGRRVYSLCLCLDGG